MTSDFAGSTVCLRDLPTPAYAEAASRRQARRSGNSASAEAGPVAPTPNLFVSGEQICTREGTLSMIL